MSVRVHAPCGTFTVSRHGSTPGCHHARSPRYPSGEGATPAVFPHRLQPSPDFGCDLRCRPAIVELMSSSVSSHPYVDVVGGGVEVCQRTSRTIVAAVTDHGRPVCGSDAPVPDPAHGIAVGSRDLTQGDRGSVHQRVGTHPVCAQPRPVRPGILTARCPAGIGRSYLAHTVPAGADPYTQAPRLRVCPGFVVT